MEPIDIKLKLYRPFLMLFCRNASAKKEKLGEKGMTRRLIPEAHASAKEIVGEEIGAPLPIPMGLADRAAALGEMKTAHIKQYEEIEAAMKLLQEAASKEFDGILSSGSSGSGPAIRAAIKIAAHAHDSDKIVSAIEEILQSVYFKFEMKIEKLQRLIKLKREQSKSIPNGMTQRDILARG